MAKDPAFLFFPGDWLGGTMNFSRHQKGAYIDLLMGQFNIGHLSIIDIETILGIDFELWETKLSVKFKQDKNGFFYNEKLEAEIQKRQKYTSGRKENLIGGISFDEFWNLYNKKVGKDKSMAEWEKVSKADREKIMIHIPLYKNSRPDKSKMKDPERYLKYKVWNDEIINANQNGKFTSKTGTKFEREDVVAGHAKHFSSKQ